MSLKTSTRKSSHIETSNVEGISVSLQQLVGLRQLAINYQAKSIVLSAQKQGQHPVSQRARGIEFAELRQYIAGDDVRAIDWRQTAKRGRVFTRDYQDEHARRILFFVDMGSSMRFATRGVYKSVMAAQVTAFLAWQAVSAEDLVGGLVFGVSEPVMLAPQGQHKGAMALLKQVSSASQQEAQTPAVSFLQQLSMLTPQHANELVIISDFVGLNSHVELQLKRLSKQVDLKLIHVFDIFEQNPPYKNYLVTDGADITEINLASESVRKVFCEPFSQRVAVLNKLARQHGWPLLSISTEDDIARQLSAFTKVVR